MEGRNLVKRSDKKAFYKLSGAEGEVFTRMKGFTELSGSKNPKEYTRQYIDESFETTDTVGYSHSISFAFDEFTNDEVLADIVDILDNELLGNDAHREIVMVNFSKPVDGGFEAIKRTFAVVGDSEGGSTDAYTYSGNLKVVGSKIVGVATIKTPENGDSETVETVTFAESVSSGN